MPAHKHCELFLPALSGSPLLWVGNGPGHFLGSFVDNRVLNRDTRLVQ